MFLQLGSLAYDVLLVKKKTPTTNAKTKLKHLPNILNPPQRFIAVTFFSFGTAEEKLKLSKTRLRKNTTNPM